MNAYGINIHPAGIHYSASTDTTILNAALSQGIPLEYSCKKGDCGLCTATIVSGCVRNEQGELIEQGTVLTCCSYPHTELHLNANYCPDLIGIECKTLPCKVISVSQLTPTIASLTLKHAPCVSFRYLAGQFIELSYQGIRRSYSIANVQRHGDELELHIRLVDKGELSPLLFAASPGQMMRFSGPLGTFFVRKSDAPVVFIATGTGFAPIKAMLEQLLQEQSTRPITLYWGMKQSADFYSEFPTQCQQAVSLFNFIPMVSGEDANWNGRRGRVSETLHEDFSDLSQHHIYVCGSAQMITDVKQACVALGAKTEHFYADAFIAS